MNHNEIQAAVDNLASLATSKGLITPHISVEIESFCNVYFRWRWSSDSHGASASETKFFDSLDEGFSHVCAIILEIPSLEDRQRNEYLKRLAAAVDYGKKIGMDEDFVNPLILQMKKLSSNIIEHKQDLNDEIPF